MFQLSVLGFMRFSCLRHQRLELADVFLSRSACFFDFWAIPGFTEGSHTVALIFTVND